MDRSASELNPSRTRGLGSGPVRALRIERLVEGKGLARPTAAATRCSAGLALACANTWAAPREAREAEALAGHES